MSNSQVKLLCGTFCVVTHISIDTKSKILTIDYIVPLFKKRIGGNFVRMNETKNVVTKEETNAERNVAGIYIRVSTEDQARERL